MKLNAAWMLAAGAVLYQVVMSTLAAQEPRDTSQAEIRRQLERARREVQKAAKEHEREMAEAMRQQNEVHVYGDEPKGWLGVNLSMDAQINTEPGGREVWKFLSYPIVEAVEPRSPAERAGVKAGDRLLALNGRNVKEGVEFRALLRPGNRLPMRVRRDDDTKELFIIVERRPERAFTFRFDTESEVSAEDSPESPVKVAPVPPRAGQGPLPPLPMVSWGFSESANIAGAEVRPVGELKEYFGVDDGLLVLRAKPGMAAARSGLRDGDVIVKAAGRSCTTVRELARAIEQATYQSLELEIIRRRDRKTVTLKW